MTIGVKLAAGAITLVACAAGLGGLGLIGLTSARTYLDHAANQYVRKVELSHEIKEGLVSLRLTTRCIVMAGAFKKDKDVEKARTDFESQAEQMAAQIREIRSIALSERGGMLLNQVEENFDGYRAGFAEVARLSAAHNFEEANSAGVRQIPYGVAMAKAADELIQLERGQLNQETAQANARTANFLWMTLVAMAISAGAGAAVLLGMRSVNLSLTQAVSQLKRGATQVASAASQISSASQSLAQGSSEQAASLEETSASSQEINAMAQKHTADAHTAAAAATESERQFEDANRALEEMTAAMGEIGASSEKISRIMKINFPI